MAVTRIGIWNPSFEALPGRFTIIMSVAYTLDDKTMAGISFVEIALISIYTSVTS